MTQKAGAILPQFEMADKADVRHRCSKWRPD
jgi:hypothetical protein